MNDIKRIYVGKKPGFDIEAKDLLKDLRENLGIKGLTGLRILNRYDVSGLTESEFEAAVPVVFSEPPLDFVWLEEPRPSADEMMFGIEYLPGQYDQRADSAAQCLQIISQKEKPLVATAKIFLLRGDMSDGELKKIKNYLINPVDSRQASLQKKKSLLMAVASPVDVEIVEGFIHMSTHEISRLRQSLELAMNDDDLAFCQQYFLNQEKRDPYITEIKMLDTYWSDHCRHTTFHTLIETVQFEDGHFVRPIKDAYHKFLKAADEIGGGEPGNPAANLCLMNIATMSMKEMRYRGLLDDMEVSGEINACSIIREVEVDGKREEWLIMFKNETHNHPTEIEPFGGAATCLGGAIRDPLSGRAYVYHAMRVTGSGDPRRKIEETIAGKLPQRKITTEAAHGFSSYGNQIGLATGSVTEIYDEGYVAKRMEVGAVIGGVPRRYVSRREPQPGDVVLLLGGRTGRDGIGGATGSSKKHTTESLSSAGAEVQKGNPPEERKLQRLFRNPAAIGLIKKCNDFGAGGVSVAIGELADGLAIDLDAVPKKYEGLDGTELGLSESQERMAVVVAPRDVETLKDMAAAENLEATVIAQVTVEPRLAMTWRNQRIVDIDRTFLDTHGVRQRAGVRVIAPAESDNFFKKIPKSMGPRLPDLKAAWLTLLQDLNICSQRGLVERFDSTVGAGSVFLPFGGKFQRTPAEAMAAKIPVLSGDAGNCSLMSYGFHPEILKWSPFHGAVYAVIEAVGKIVAAGGDYRRIRCSLQEYFEKLGRSPEKWGKPFAALLGAYHALSELGIAAIGGKDSMSGSFMDLNVPPTLITFAVEVIDVGRSVSPEFKRVGSTVVYIEASRDEYEMPCFHRMKNIYRGIENVIKQGKVLAAHTVRYGGVAEAISKMSFGNGIGFRFRRTWESVNLFRPGYGSFLLEMDTSADPAALFEGIDYEILGETVPEPSIRVNGTDITLEEALGSWEAPLEKVFPTRKGDEGETPAPNTFNKRSLIRPAIKKAKPRVLVTAFPGTNCEYDTAAAFERAGATADILVFRNRSADDISASLEELKLAIDQSQILVIPGGFSAGDEPEGSGKFIATVFRNPAVNDAVNRLLEKRDGLILGICNGFQALIKLGLLPFGRIRELTGDMPTLTFNTLGRHVSRMVRTRVTSVLSPWFSGCRPGEAHTIPVSHGEGRFICGEEMLTRLHRQGQVATQYVDWKGKPANDIEFNPNGSDAAVEGLTSPDGRILGKMGHSERIAPYVARNIPGNKDQKLFESGVNYFK